MNAGPVNCIRSFRYRSNLKSTPDPFSLSNSCPLFLSKGSSGGGITLSLAVKNTESAGVILNLPTCGEAFGKH